MANFFKSILSKKTPPKNEEAEGPTTTTVEEDYEVCGCLAINACCGVAMGEGDLAVSRIKTGGNAVTLKIPRKSANNPLD